jgi:hypothetical protein
MDIPISQGPENYWGLPGLILEVNDGTTTILCSKIVINPKDRKEIKQPKKGTPITQKEFEKIGLDTNGATIEELMAQISLMFLEGYTSKIEEDHYYSLGQFKQTEFYKTRYVLLNHLKEVGFYLYDYKEEIMPEKIKAFYKKNKKEII